MPVSPSRPRPSSPWNTRGTGTGAFPSTRGSHSETSPLLPTRSSAASTSYSTHTASPRPDTTSAGPRPARGDASDASSSSAVGVGAESGGDAGSVAASSLSVNDSSQGGGSILISGSSRDGGGGRSDASSSGGGSYRGAGRDAGDAGDEDDNDGGGDGGGGGGAGGAEFRFGASPSSPSEFVAIFAHAVQLQSWTSWLLAVAFHVFHLLLVLAFLLSPILFRSTVFSSQTMARSLLETQGVIKHRGDSGDDAGRNSVVTAGVEAGAVVPELPASVSRAPVTVESVWAIHDAIFFLEPGHVVMSTTISNSFASLRHNEHHNSNTNKKGDEEDPSRLPDKGGGGGPAAAPSGGAAGKSSKGGGRSGGDGGGDQHTFVVPHKTGDGDGDYDDDDADDDDGRDDDGDATARRAEEDKDEKVTGGVQRVTAPIDGATSATASTSTTTTTKPARASTRTKTTTRPAAKSSGKAGKKRHGASRLRAAMGADGVGAEEGSGMLPATVLQRNASLPQPWSVFAAPPPVAPEYTGEPRKSSTSGQVTLLKILNAWEASPLYSSPLALTLFYYLYGVGCIILLLTVTDGMLTGHFAVLRLGIAVAELLWYIHHGTHAFVIFCWMVLLSHWPQHAVGTLADAPFLERGTPYALVTKKTGKVAIYWFYRASGDAGDKGGGAGKLLTREVDLSYYLYAQVWYLKPLAEGVAVFYLCLLVLCLVKDIHRVLDAVVGVRELMEPEGCVRCPLCGELMEVCEQRSLLRRNSIYQSSRDRSPWSVRQTRWWWRWLRSAVRGSSSGHRVPTPRLYSPLWRWLLPGWCGGGPQTALDATTAVSSALAASREDARADGAEPSLAALVSDEAPYSLADMAEDVEFYEQSAVRRSAAAPQDTTTQETAHLMRWLTAMPRAERYSLVRAKEGEEQSVSRSGRRASRMSRGDVDGEDEEDEGNAASAAANALALGSSASSSSSEEAGGGLVRTVPASSVGTAGGGGGGGAAGGTTTASTAAAAAATAFQRATSAVAQARSNESSDSASPTRRQRRRSQPTSRHRSRNRSIQRQRTQSMSQPTTPAQRPQRRTRFTEEVLYWKYATRHVHHRCPKLYLDAAEASDDEEEETEEDEDAEDSSSSGSGSGSGEGAGSGDEGSGSTGGTRPLAATTATALPAGAARRRRVSDVPVATAGPTSAATRAHVGSVATAADRANFSQRGLRRSLSPRAADTRSSPTSSEAVDSLRSIERRRHAQQAQRDGQRGGPALGGSNVRNYGTLGRNFSEAPSQLFARGPPPGAGPGHIVQRGVYDPTKEGDDEFRPGNAFQSYDRAGWLSRLTYTWLNPLLTFGLLEPTLLRQERFLPSLPESLLSLDNILVPAWRLWVHRKVWFSSYVAKPGELLIPSNEAMNRAEEEAMSLADLYEVDGGDDGEETESSEGRQTVVMLGQTALKQAAKFRPQRPRRGWQENAMWALTAPLRYALVTLFYYVYLGTSRTVRRTRRRLVRELLKDRLAAAAEEMYDTDGYHAIEATEAIEEATWALAEMASSCGSSAAAPSAGSALPTHMRRQLALSDVSLYYLFLEHRCGRCFLLVAAPLLLLSEALTLAIVPGFDFFTVYLRRVDFDILPHRREAPSDQRDVTAALLWSAALGAVMLLQGLVHGAYLSQVQQAAMEARTCVRAMVLEKTLALPLAQRTFSEAEVVTLATEEAARVATCLASLHHCWSSPLRIALLALLLAYYVGWAAAAVTGLGPLITVPLIRYAAHEVRERRHEAREATAPRLTLLQHTLSHIREVKVMLLEGRLARRLRKARAAEASSAEAVAMAEGTAGALAGGVACLLLVAALGTQCVVDAKPLRDMDVLVPVLVIFVLLTAPLLELPVLFTVVARGFLSMKRIEAYLRQTPDEFVGTWVDLTSFTAMQQQLREEDPSSALLQYRRGSVVCRDSSFTWQHDLTEEAPTTLLRDVDMCIEPGQLVIVQGSMGTGKSTLLLSILGEVNRCVSAAAAASSTRNSSMAGYESESSLSVVSASEAASALAAGEPRRQRGSATTAAATALPSANPSIIADSLPPNIFVASPTDSVEPRQRRTSGGEEASTHLTASPAVTRTPSASGRTTVPSSSPPPPLLPLCASGGGTPHIAQLRSRAAASAPQPRTATNSFAGDRASVGSGTTATASQRHPPGLDSADSSTGGFLVFGSCAYCAEVPWLQNDTIRANIMSSGGGPIQLERWYHTVLRACALSAEVAALPQGDATVIGECGELLSLSMRCRIAIARAVYSKSHVYLMDSVLSPLEPLIQQHIIREVFHKLLRKKTVILASNVGLRLLRPHRVFSVVEDGVVREDTGLYKAVSSLHAPSDEEDDMDERGEERAAASAAGSGEGAMGAAAGDAIDADPGTRPEGRGGGWDRRVTGAAREAGASDRDSADGDDDGDASRTTALPLPPLYAEQFEEPQEMELVELDAEVFAEDPTVAAAALLFDGDDDFGPRDLLLHNDIGDRPDGGVSAGDLSLANSVLLASAATGASASASLRLRRAPHFGQGSPRRMDGGRSGATSGTNTPGLTPLPPAVVPLEETAAGHAAAFTAAVGAAAAASRDAERVVPLPPYSIEAGTSQVSVPLSAASAAAAADAPDVANPFSGVGDAVRRDGDDASRFDSRRSEQGTTSETGDAATTEGGSQSTCSANQYIRNHYAQQLERERVLRHRHRLSFFIFLRFMGGQVIWLLLTTLLHQAVVLGADVWAAVWLTVMASDGQRRPRELKKKSAGKGGGGGVSYVSHIADLVYASMAVPDTVFLGIVSVFCVVAMLLTLLRTRAVYVGVYGTMRFLYDQIMRRVLHSPASYFDSRIIALLTRVLRDDGDVAEFRVPSTAELLLSCTAQVALVAVWNVFVNPIFFLLLPMAVSLFFHIMQRHAVVLREVRRLELGSVSGMADILREVYQGAATVRCMALQDRLREEYCRSLDTVNTASMVAYLVDRWVELRLHLLATLAVCTAAIVGILFTFPHSRPSFTAVAMLAGLRAAPVLVLLCRHLGTFTVTEWISVQRLMSLWSVPQEPLTLVGDADLYTYSHVRRNSTGAFVQLEGGHDASLFKIVGPPISPTTHYTIAAQQRAAHDKAKQERRQRREQQPSARRAQRLQQRQQEAGTSITGVDSASLPEMSVSPTSLSIFAYSSTTSTSSTSSSSSSSSAATRAAGAEALAPSASCTMTLPLLELRNVSARYRTTLPYVLRHVNLAVYPGERLGVVGHAGQGKGSVFNVLLRLVDVIEGGGVIVDGEDAARVPYPILRGRFGLVPQEPLLVQGSWRSNLLFGYHPEHRMLLDAANHKGQLPFLPIESMARQPPHVEVEAGEASSPRPPAEGNAQETQPLLRRGAGRLRSRASAPERAAPPPRDSSVASASASAEDVSYGSTDSAHPGNAGPHLRFMESAEEQPPSRDLSRGSAEAGASRRGSGRAGGFASAVVRRVRDVLGSPFRRRASRSNSGAPRQRSPSRGGSSGARRRRRTSRGAGGSDGQPHQARGRDTQGPRQPVEDAALWAALRAVGLDAAVEFDGGLDAPLVGGDLTAAGLTESQCRLLCLARAVLNRPPIILLEDAVYAGAEAQTDRAIRRVLANELRDSTVLIIAHRMSTVLSLCTRVVAVHGGVLFPIADLPPTAASPLSPQPSGPADGFSSLVSTPSAAAAIEPAVMKQLSYYVE